ncbi:MBL fold metallo-hydrolase [Actinoplanes sp. TBRC 11911]|uniref:MBL fold metallo-hydrolase n=1 Tax=Actinoplanes sp. TBRC 11911 TaxID=2729386 RepID=UPI00145DD4EE|nr:MBL fold metallo-hydrolase [Actinoplanes sp. TBRC 11911]NMO50362.1 MBL fold metallo-hydrolase [Actinoplanes sp. TBRC 11911]
MQITKFSHSCVRVEGAGVLVLDPGVWSEQSALDGADAVLITHQHADHVNVDAVTEAAARQPGLRVYAHADVLATLPAIGSAGTAIDPGQELEVAGYRVRTSGGEHAVIHPDIPVIPNVAVLVSDDSGNFFHPGDSFTVPEDTEVDTLFVPLNAPWMKVSEAIDFVRAIHPRRAYALHDGLLNDTGAGLYGSLLERLGGTTYKRLAPGTTID